MLRSTSPDFRGFRSSATDLGEPWRGDPPAVGAQRNVVLEQRPWLGAPQPWPDWRRRAAAQHKSNMLTLGQAEATERAAMEALQKIRPLGRP